MANKVEAVDVYVSGFAYLIFVSASLANKQITKDTISIPHHFHLKRLNDAFFPHLAKARSRRGPDPQPDMLVRRFDLSQPFWI